MYNPGQHYNCSHPTKWNNSELAGEISPFLWSCLTRWVRVPCRVWEKSLSLWALEIGSTAPPGTAGADLMVTWAQPAQQLHGWSTQVQTLGVCISAHLTSMRSTNSTSSSQPPVLCFSKLARQSCISEAGADAHAKWLWSKPLFSYQRQGKQLDMHLGKGFFLPSPIPANFSTTGSDHFVPWGCFTKVILFFRILNEVSLQFPLQPCWAISLYSCKTLRSLLCGQT